MVVTTHITERGRIVIPAELRRALGLRAGDKVVLRLEDGELRLYSMRHAIKRAQDIVSVYLQNSPSMADEPIAERRVEAKHK